MNDGLSAFLCKFATRADFLEILVVEVFQRKIHMVKIWVVIWKGAGEKGSKTIGLDSNTAVEWRSYRENCRVATELNNDVDEQFLEFEVFVVRQQFEMFNERIVTFHCQ